MSVGGRQVGVIVASSVAVAVTVVAVGACASADDASSIESGQAATSTTHLPSTQTTTSLPPATTTTTVPPTPAPIPGLVASTLQGQLTDNGFVCVPSDSHAEGYQVVDCATLSDAVATVRIVATPADEVVAMEGSAYIGTEDQRWLDFLATRTWDGADPSAAQAWLDAAMTSSMVLGHPGTNVGGQPFHLYADGTGRLILDIGV